MEVLAATLFLGAAIIGTIVDAGVAICRVADAMSERRLAEYAYLGEWSKYIGISGEAVLMWLTLFVVQPVEFLDSLAKSEIVERAKAPKGLHE